MPRTILALVDLKPMQSALIGQLLGDEDGIEIVSVAPEALGDADADAVIGSAAALGQRQVCELLESAPRVRALIMRGDLADASLYQLRPHVEHFGDLSATVLRRLVAPRRDWNP